MNNVKKLFRLFAVVFQVNKLFEDVANRDLIPHLRDLKPQQRVLILAS